MATRIDDGDGVCFEMDCALASSPVPQVTNSDFAARMRCAQPYKSSFFLKPSECSLRRNMLVDANFDLW